MDAHKETREKLDKTINHLAETRIEIEKTRQEYADFIKKLKEDDDSKVKRQKDFEQEQSVKLMIDEAAAYELEKLKVKHKAILEEHQTLTATVQTLETERSDLETTLAKLKASGPCPA